MNFLYQTIADYYSKDLQRCRSFAQLKEIKQKAHTQQLEMVDFYGQLESHSKMAETFEKLLSQGADPNFVYFKSTKTLLAEWLIFLDGRPNLLLFETFLKYGVDPTKMQRLLHTLVNCSRFESETDYRNSLKIIEMIISHGGDPNFQYSAWEEDETISPYRTYQYCKEWKHSFPEPEWFEPALKALLKVE